MRTLTLSMTALLLVASPLISAAIFGQTKSIPNPLRVPSIIGRVFLRIARLISGTMISTKLVCRRVKLGCLSVMRCE